MLDFENEAVEILERLTRADGVVITRKEIIAAALTKAYHSGLERAATYCEAEIGSERMAPEIRKLFSCT